MTPRERLYAILRHVKDHPEPRSGVRVGVLSYNETVAFDTIAALLDEVASDARKVVMNTMAKKKGGKPPKKPAKPGEYQAP